ncbi:hypothetical protein [Jannaschia rubra]|uniref:hypothetical protein n=1 Tax=Jannaschia rubra TaxID=282197 RepID=UPI0006E2D8A3|nr:hypothetical protein [Jannaschia rubra]
MAGRWLIWQRLPERQGTFDGPEMVQVETGAPGSSAAFDRSALVRLRGDPLILRLADEEAGAPSTLTTPPTLADRIGAGPVGVIATPLLMQAARLATALLSSREDFALFQAQRTEDLASLLDDGTEAPAAPGRTLTGEEAEAAAGSWGAALDTGETVQRVTFTRTAIENTTSVATVLPEVRRRPLFEDRVVVVRLPQPLGALLAARCPARGIGDRPAAGRRATCCRCRSMDPRAMLSRSRRSAPSGSWRPPTPGSTTT